MSIFITQVVYFNPLSPFAGTCTSYFVSQQWGYLLRGYNSIKYSYYTSWRSWDGVWL